MRESKRVLIIGGGGREHALAARLRQEAEIYTLPGNPGTAEIGTNVDMPLDTSVDLDNLADFIADESIDMVVVGPEKYLERGVVDYLESVGVTCVGTKMAASLLEGSKSYAKAFMVRHGIPTARYSVCTNRGELMAALDSSSFPVVLKADGLAGGKGVIICNSETEALTAINTLIDISPKVVVEEFLTGTEASFLCLVDGKNILPLPPARDHKRLLNGGNGPNTGGMGAICGAGVVPEKVMENFVDQVARPFMEGIKADAIDFRGVLFVGVMYDKEGNVNVLEFNTRFGDPECDVVVPRIKGSFYEMLEATAKGRLAELFPTDDVIIDASYRFSDDAYAAVILAAKEYPYEKTMPVPIVMEQDVNLLHSGTSIDSHGRLMATGGRVLACIGYGQSLEDAINAAYEEVKKVDFRGMQYRTDIGREQ